MSAISGHMGLGKELLTCMGRVITGNAVVGRGPNIKPKPERTFDAYLQVHLEDVTLLRRSFGPLCLLVADEDSCRIFVGFLSIVVIR